MESANNNNRGGVKKGERAVVGEKNRRGPANRPGGFWVTKRAEEKGGTDELSLPLFAVKLLAQQGCAER